MLMRAMATRLGHFRRRLAIPSRDRGRGVAVNAAKLMARRAPLAALI